MPCWTPPDRRRPRRPGPAHRRAELCPAGGSQRAFEAGLSRPGVAEDRRRGPPGMPYAQGKPWAENHGHAQARGSAVPGLRRGRMEGSPFRGIQAVHEKGRAVRARPPAAAGLWLEAARPHRPGAHQPMVRPVQPDRPRQCQSRARSSHADRQLRDRARSPRHQPGAVRATEPETGAHALSVPGGDRPATSGAGRADPQQQV